MAPVKMDKGATVPSKSRKGSKGAKAVEIDLSAFDLTCPEVPKKAPKEVETEPRAPKAVELGDIEAQEKRRNAARVSEKGAPVASRAPVGGIVPGHVSEALGVLVVHWPALPLPSSLVCSCAGGEFVITTTRKGFDAALRDGVPVFVGGELLAMGIACEFGRFRSLDLVRELERKRRTPRGRLTPARAFDGGLVIPAERCTLDLDALTDSLGITIERVEFYE